MLLRNIKDRFNRWSFILIQAVKLSVGNKNGASPEERSLIRSGFDLTGQFKYCTACLSVFLFFGGGLDKK